MSKRLTIEEFIKTLSKGGSGGSGDTLVVNVVKDDSNERLDKTWQEIKDALDRAVIHVTVGSIELYGIIPGVSEDSDMSSYSVSFSGNTYTTTSPDGYPTMASTDSHNL